MSLDDDNVKLKHLLLSLYILFTHYSLVLTHYYIKILLCRISYFIVQLLKIGISVTYYTAKLTIVVVC